MLRTLSMTASSDPLTRNDSYNVHLGDKVAFKLSREDASPENYTDVERIAITAVLCEQFRKRDLKKAEELKYRTLLILADKNTHQGPRSRYSRVCEQLLGYLNAVQANSIQNPVDTIKDHIQLTGIQDENTQKFLISVFSDPTQIRLEQEGQFDHITVDFILNKLVEYCVGEYTLETIRSYLSHLYDHSTRIEPGLLDYYRQLILNYTKNYLENKNPLEEENTFIVNRLTRLGILFDNIYGFLIDRAFTYQSITDGNMSEQGFYYCGVKVLDVYWHDARFYYEKSINGVPVYKKHRLLDDTPWKGREGLSENDYEYILDKRHNFIKRFGYRFIRPTERMVLAQSYSGGIYSTDTLASFAEIEGNSSREKYFIPNPNMSGSFQQALTEELGEFSLNRMGTSRFIPISHAGHKYDIRANDEILFLRQASTFESIDHSVETAWQGGGLIKIDLTFIDKEEVRCQYKAAARVNMEKTRDSIVGIVKKKSLKACESLTEEQWSAELNTELYKAKKSAIRNRESHVFQIPTRSIMGWKPYPQYPIWLATNEVTLPIISLNQAYFVAYPLPVGLPRNIDFLTFGLDTSTEEHQEVAAERANPFIDRYIYFLETLATQLNGAEAPFNADLVTKVLQAVAVNVNYLKKYLNQKSPDEINLLIDLVFAPLIRTMKKYDALVSLKQIVDDLHPLIEYTIAQWIKPGDNHFYLSSIGMAFYMSPQKTVSSSVPAAFHAQLQGHLDKQLLDRFLTAYSHLLQSPQSIMENGNTITLIRTAVEIGLRLDADQNFTTNKSFIWTQVHTIIKLVLGDYRPPIALLTTGAYDPPHVGHVCDSAKVVEKFLALGFSNVTADLSPSDDRYVRDNKAFKQKREGLSVADRMELLEYFCCNTTTIPVSIRNLLRVSGIDGVEGTQYPTFRPHTQVFTVFQLRQPVGTLAFYFGGEDLLKNKLVAREYEATNFPIIFTPRDETGGPSSTKIRGITTNSDKEMVRLDPGVTRDILMLQEAQTPGVLALYVEKMVSLQFTQPIFCSWGQIFQSLLTDSSLSVAYTKSCRTLAETREISAKQQAESGITAACQPPDFVDPQKSACSAMMTTGLFAPRTTLDTKVIDSSFRQ